MLSPANFLDGAAWLALAAGEGRQHRGNDGYSDEPSAEYTWDTTVPNHSKPKVGDAIVLWDKKTLLGASVIESIEILSTTKPLHRCPACGQTKIKGRFRKTPAFRCYACSAEFDLPQTEIIDVMSYRTSHESGWVDLKGVLDGPQLRKLCVSPRSQLSLRPLRWADFRLAAEAEELGEAFTNFDATRDRLGGGHSLATVRVRAGQGAFRRRLIQEQGLNCAFTGPAPAEVLEAGHLYSYANEGRHHESGGLLFRRDLHRLFDLGYLSVEPASFTIDVLADLVEYPLYMSLHGKPLLGTLTPKHKHWLSLHWNQHRL